MKVWKDYNALRTIVLKELSMQAFKKEDQTDMPTTKKMKAIITLNATTGGANPISEVKFEEYGTEKGMGSFYKNEAGDELDESYKTFQGSFVPQGVTRLVLTSRYDVYDKKGNLIRKDCTATNTLEISSLYPTQTEARRGSRYTVNLIIKPTYLYVLSEPDLDNPTVVLNEQ